MNLSSQFYFLTLAFGLLLVLAKANPQNKTEVATSVTTFSLLDRLRSSISKPSSTTEPKSNKINEHATSDEEEDDDNEVDDDTTDDTDSDEDDDEENDDTSLIKPNKTTALVPSGARFIGLKTFFFTIKAIIIGSLIGLTIKDALIRGLLWAVGLYIKHLLFPNLLSAILGTGLLGFG